MMIKICLRSHVIVKINFVLCVSVISHSLVTLLASCISSVGKMLLIYLSDCYLRYNRRLYMRVFI
jgi:membrane-anchored protein YejM (alkaline phosphatase superfamily)